MAHNNDRKRARPEDEDDATVATAGGMHADDADDGDDDRAGDSAPREEAAPPARGFFDIYKPGQGRYTRLGTAMAAGILVIWGALYLHHKLQVVGNGTTTEYIQAGAALVVILGGGLVGYRVLSHNRRVSDFLIATEGEMKKVAWTSKQDLTGSTKVVILVVLLMALFLFTVDFGLMWFFTEIKVLRIMPDSFRRLFGGE